MLTDSRRGRVDSNRIWRKKDDLGSSFEVLSQEEPATALSSPDRPEPSEGHRNCAHFVLTPTTLQLIPHDSTFFEEGGTHVSRCWPECCGGSLSELE